MSKVAIQGNASGTGTFTIAAPNSNTDRTLTLPDEAGTVLTSASSITQNSGPAFSAYMSSNQSVSEATFTKLQFNAEFFDTDNCFDSTTNYRFTPTVEGYYNVSWGASNSSGTGRASLVELYKNGSALRRIGIFLSSSTELDDPFFMGNLLVYMNGSTDYLEVYGAGWGLTTFIGSSSRSSFTAYLARAV